MKVEHIGDATLYLGDCLEVLPTLEKVDAVVTDPPYGIADKPNAGATKGLLEGRRGRRIGRTNDWHPESDWDRQIDPRLAPAIGAACDVILWFGHWRKRLEVEASMPLPLRAEIVWAKDMHCGPPCPLAMRDERIWVFSRHGLTRPFETTVWDEPVIPTWRHKAHKNEKPVRLMERAVKWASDGVTLDPFMGSGTTGVACMNLGRKFIGIEIEPRYFELACERIDQAQRQGRLFA